MNQKEMAALGARVREARQAKRLTMSDLARHANVSHAAISYVEHGRCYPSAKLLMKLAAALDMSLSELVSGEPSKLPPPSSHRQSLRLMAVESPAAHALMKDALSRAKGGPLEEY